MTAQIDVHQHLWPESLLSALAARPRPPYLRRRGRGEWELTMAGEPRWPVLEADHDPVARAAQARTDGLALALMAPSAPLGIEALPADEAHFLVAAYNKGTSDLPSGLRPWAAAALDEPDPAALAAALAAGAVGLCLPAAALVDPAGVERIGGLIAVVAAHGGALFVHPGPAPWAPSAPAPAAAPAWWAALTVYVAQMQAAWFGALTWLRPRHPDLRICFAMLAGLAPLHHERANARGGPPAPTDDPNLFYDTSSYGPEAVAALAAVVGREALVYGSDRPVVVPSASVDPTDIQRGANPRRLLAVPEETR